MNEITIYWDELKIKTLVERLTHIKSANYFTEFSYEMRTRLDLLTCELGKDINFATFCAILAKLEQRK